MANIMPLLIEIISLKHNQTWCVQWNNENMLGSWKLYLGENRFHTIANKWNFRTGVSEIPTSEGRFTKSDKLTI